MWFRIGLRFFNFGWFASIKLRTEFRSYTSGLRFESLAGLDILRQVFFASAEVPV